jgi:hypothetical protein
VPIAGSKLTGAPSPPPAWPNWTKAIFPDDGAGLASMGVVATLSILAVQTRNLFMQQENQKRQRSLEAFKAVSDFNESYAKLVDSIPQGSRIVLDDRKANFLLEKIPVEGAPGNTGNEIVKHPFTSHESFFRRYWMLQMAQYQSKEERFLPEETFTIWIRSNIVVYTQGTYWISAEAYAKGYKECRALFQDIECTGDKKVNEFIKFMNKQFNEPEDKSVLSQPSGVALDQESSDMANPNRKAVVGYLKDVL